MNPKNNGMSSSDSGINNAAFGMQNIDNAGTLDESNQNIQNPDARKITHFTGFSVVPPNESRRSKMQRIAQQEQNDLDKWKEEHRPGPIQLDPEKLGGSVSFVEVRQRQQMEASNSKLQKKLKKEEMDKRRRQEEEEQNQKMKAIQREKANKLEMKKQQEEQQRKELYQLDLLRKREKFLQRFERTNSVPMATTNSTLTSSWAQGHEYREGRKTEEQAALQRMKEDQRRKSELLEENQKQQEDMRKRQMESEHVRVNSAFLDRLEARGSGRASESLPCALEGGNIWQADEPRDPASSPGPFPSQVHSDGDEEEEKEDADHDWAVMRLQTDFPYYERALLDEIVSQCNGNYHQAYYLLYG